ncbi:MAG: hypothetical protein N3A60_04870 [Thermanaerothrix sp.]|nr:hypothetical protein [Thermanaerothrix sp.]
MSPNSRLSASDTWIDLLHVGVEILVGAEGMATPASSLLESLPQRYGRPTAQGLAWRAGRAAWPWLYRSHHKIIGLEDITFWLLPLRRRLSQGLQTTVAFLQSCQGWALTLDETPTEWHLLVQRVPPPSPDPAHLWCWFLGGLVQEFLAWAGGARVYPLRTLTCGSAPSETTPCRIVFGRAPLD